MKRQGGAEPRVLAADAHPKATASAVSLPDAKQRSPAPYRIAALP